ncbi:YecH family metal-binding protein [Rubellicoccus peritrichatus]|uniref:YecH family protein n=1 Tax=Rubellicoccus peritrichatus TaxID=3080537 RepID=A0AAQ3L7T0_9BACT|nr:YecH family metal-binding protein [Puniceicoccus sp. CR14]WOO40656.1 YecH family protein [Puniceicoccus sp. CR14]
MTANEEIHGHEVLEMMMNSGKRYSRDSLIKAINERFGESSRFYICSGGGMDAAQLVDVLIGKGKFMGPEDAFVFNPATKCDH